MSEWKPGDKLAFRRKWDNAYDIYDIKSITPAGFIVVGPYRLNPDLTIRGRSAWGPYKAEPVTGDVVKANRRYSTELFLRAVNWKSYPDDVLEEVKAVLEKNCGRTKDEAECS